MNEPEISVVIVSYNVWSYIQPCIKSVLSQLDVTTEIIVIDNNSTDGSAGLITKEFPAVSVITNTENKGFSGANNQGINIAKGKYLLLLNPDTLIRENNVLFEMLRYLKSKNDSTVLAPCLLNTDGSFQPSFWETSFLSQLFLELFYFHLFTSKKRPHAVISVQAASGAALLFERSLIEMAGLLDENMFWMEDIDFCYRVRKAGGAIVYCPSIEIIHHGGKSSDNYSVVLPNQVLSKVKFYKKHGSVIQYAAVNLFSLLFIISRWLAFALLSLSANTTFIAKRKAYVIALKGYFNYIFTNDSAIVNIKA